MSIDENPYTFISVNDNVTLTVNYRGLQVWSVGVVKSLEYSDNTGTEFAVVQISGTCHYIPTKFLKLTERLPKTPTLHNDLFE